MTVMKRRKTRRISRRVRRNKVLNLILQYLHILFIQCWKLFTASFKFTQGGVCQFEDEVSQGRGGYFGWMGFGGSVFQWHPELKIGFGYVPTLLTWIDLANNKGRLLQEEVRKCAAALNKA